MIFTFQTFAVLIVRYPDTPCISQTLSVVFSESHSQSVVDAVNSLGELSMTGTLQIAELTEQPGAILVQWYDEVRLPSYSIVLAEYQGRVVQSLIKL